MTRQRSTPTFFEAVSEIVDSKNGRQHVSIPAKVTEYNKDKQTVTAQPVIRSRFVDSETGESEYILPPPIPNIPVQFPQGDGFSMTWPLANGDIVELVFADRSLDEWQATASTDNIAQDHRRFDLSDAVAIPGVRSPADPLPADAVDDNAVVMKLEELIIGDATISTYIARADKTAQRIKRLEEKFEAHVHSVAYPAIPAALGPTTPTPSATPPTTAQPYTTENDVRTNKVKGD